jgi:hypothetical protein
MDPPHRIVTSTIRQSSEPQKIDQREGPLREVSLSQASGKLVHILQHIANRSLFYPGDDTLRGSYLLRTSPRAPGRSAAWCMELPHMEAVFFEAA